MSQVENKIDGACGFDLPRTWKRERMIVLGFGVWEAGCIFGKRGFSQRKNMG